MKRGKKARVHTIGLNLVLWFTFLLFSIVLIVFFTVSQYTQMNRQYRQKREENLSEASALLTGMFASGMGREGMKSVLLSVTNQYAVSAYLFLTKGENVFIYPDLLESLSEEYAQIYHMVDEQFEKIEEANRPLARISFSSKEFVGYATLVELDGQDCYLYLSSSFAQFNEMMKETLWLSIITALFAVALSFVVSGFVSMAITKPVTDLTERAKELARGDYEVNFGQGYFCNELNELSQTLDYASREISKADKMQKELIANVSHDFKTPLTMIKAYASMIQDIAGDDPVKRDKHTRIIIEETDRLAALVGDLLDLSKLRAGIEAGERTVFNLSEDVYRVVGRFDYLKDLQDYKIETEVEEDLYTYACRERIEQVLYNLIGNAVNYTGESKKVVVRLKKAQGCARFEVLDFGMGIPPEELDTIWERYYRTSESHKRAVNGTGLGLAIVKGVLLKQGIPFGVTSEVGKGSCFWVDFPDPPKHPHRSETESVPYV